MPLEHAVDEYSLRDSILTPSELIKDGNLIIPNGNGLGGSINLEFIKKYGVEFIP
jgi:L-alanine-DL-glutamate epimerase-like enolase superfamily enzyme